MKSQAENLVAHCEELVRNGEADLASIALEELVAEFSKRISNLVDPKGDLVHIEKIGHLIGIENAFVYAEDFYESGDKKSAREWLYLAKDHANAAGLNIKLRIKEIKGTYKDRLPLIF